MTTLSSHLAKQHSTKITLEPADIHHLAAEALWHLSQGYAEDLYEAVNEAAWRCLGMQTVREMTYLDYALIEDAANVARFDGETLNVEALIRNITTTGEWDA